MESDGGCGMKEKLCGSGCGGAGEDCGTESCPCYGCVAFFSEALCGRRRGCRGPSSCHSGGPAWLPARDADKYSPSRYDFRWNEDYTAFVPMRCLRGSSDHLYLEDDNG
jgi:hypothetical protein